MVPLTPAQQQERIRWQKEQEEFIRTHPNPYQDSDTGKWFWRDAELSPHGPYEFREDAETELDSYTNYRYRIEGRF